jgi:hypothetical protein
VRVAEPRQGRKILGHSASCGYGRVGRISPVGAAERRRFRLYGGCAVGCVGALLTFGGAGTFEGPSAGMSAGAAGEIARATKGCHRGLNPVAAGGRGFAREVPA